MAVILIVDDERATRELIAQAAESSRHTAIRSPNGRHAWEILQANPQINMIITDVMMPEMNGKDLIGVIRGNTDFRHLPVVIMSAVVSAKEVANLLNTGATFFAQKPIKVDEIQHYISRCLQPV